MKTIRRIVTGLLIIAVLGSAGWYFFLREDTIRFTEEVARTADIETFYTFTGNVESRGAQIYTSGFCCPLRKRNGREGSHGRHDL